MGGPVADPMKKSAKSYRTPAKSKKAVLKAAIKNRLR